VILCGGLGTRIKRLTQTNPKILINIEKKPFLYHLLKILKKNKIKNIYLLTQYKSAQIEKYVKNIKYFNFFVLKDGGKKLGTGGSLKKKLKELPNYFFLTYGDSYLDINYSVLRKKLISVNKSVISIYKNNDKKHQNNILVKKRKIIKYDKTKNFNYIDYGLFLFKREDLEDIKMKKENFDLVEYLSTFIKNNKFTYIISKKRFHECGSFDGIERIKKILNS
jgi:NDP-sugar pyrophosphorylase family protein